MCLRYNLSREYKKPYKILLWGLKIERGFIMNNKCAFFNFYAGKNGRGVGRCKILKDKCCDQDNCNFKKSPFQLYESEKCAEDKLKAKGLEKTYFNDENGIQCVGVKRIK